MARTTIENYIFVAAEYRFVNTIMKQVTSEAEGSLIKIQTYVTQETDLDLIAFARERGIFEEFKSLDLDSGRPKTVRIPNKSRAVREALEEYFAGRKKR